MDSFGPVQTRRARHGECRYCHDELHARLRHFSFDCRPHLIGQVCKHRLPEPTCKIPHFKRTANNSQIRLEHHGYRRFYSLLTDYFGEIAELRPGPTNDRLPSDGYNVRLVTLEEEVESRTVAGVLGF